MSNYNKGLVKGRGRSLRPLLKAVSRLNNSEVAPPTNSAPFNDQDLQKNEFETFENEPDYDLQNDLLNDAFLDQSSPAIRRINTKVFPLSSAHKSNHTICSPISLSPLFISTTPSSSRSKYRKKSSTHNFIDNIAQLDDIAVVIASPNTPSSIRKPIKLKKTYFTTNRRTRLRQKKDILKIINEQLAIHLKKYGKQFNFFLQSKIEKAKLSKLIIFG
jgi:hypothetical protein